VSGYPDTVSIVGLSSMEEQDVYGTMNHVVKVRVPNSGLGYGYCPIIEDWLDEGVIFGD
jgi:hypothetical protein